MCVHVIHKRNSIRSWKESKMFGLLPLVVFLTLPQISFTACHGSLTSYRAEFKGEYTVDNVVLVGHVFSRFSVPSFSKCFKHCDDDCRCRSFNLPMTGEGECQLNSADNSTVLIKPLRGWRYHHLQVKEVKEGADTCYEPYSNGCCDSQPCQNDATCVEVGDRGKPGFDCTCADVSHTGPMCERTINSCFDYMWHDKNAYSGYYDIWDKDTLVKSRVYCDMRPKELESWTLVMSTKRNEIEPFFEDAPIDETNADSGEYRLSLAKMESIKAGMSSDRSVEWKATCGYSFVDHVSTNEEVVRSFFSTLNLLTFKTLGLVGYYPFNNVTRGEDRSGYGNNATMNGIQYEDGPLDIPGGSAMMSGSQDSYIELNDYSGMLDTRYSLTMMLQFYPYVTNQAPLLMWRKNHLRGVHLWAFDGSIYFQTHSRDGKEMERQEEHNQIHENEWNHIAVSYDYDTGHQIVYKNGLNVSEVWPGNKELATDSSWQLTIGVRQDDKRYLNGRVACVRIFNTALTADTVKDLSNGKCPNEPANICHRVDYIKIRDRECYNCHVWAVQTSSEGFHINAYRGDRKCNFHSGSTVVDENIFGRYKAFDSATHSCAGTSDSTTQYWFGGRL